MFSIHHHFLDHFCLCVMTLWTNSQFCSFVTTLLTTFVHRQRQGPSCTLACGATMVLAQDTWFGRRLDSSPVLTFWRFEFSLIEHGVAPTGLQQLNVELFLIRGGDCSPIPFVAALTTAANSDSPLLKAKTPIVLDHAYTNWPLHIATPPTRFSRGAASSKVCIAEHLNLGVHLGP